MSQSFHASSLDFFSGCIAPKTGKLVQLIVQGNSLCEQVLFVYVYTIIPPRLSDPCDFITVSNPGTGADDGLLF